MPNALDYILALGQGGVRGIKEQQAINRELAKERQLQLEREREFEANQGFREETLGLQRDQLGLEKLRMAEDKIRNLRRDTEEGRRFDITTGLQRDELGLGRERLAAETDYRNRALDLEALQERARNAVNIALGSQRTSGGMSDQLRLVLDAMGPPDRVEILTYGPEEAMRRRLAAAQEYLKGQTFTQGAGTAANRTTPYGELGYKQAALGDTLGLR